MVRRLLTAVCVLAMVAGALGVVEHRQVPIDLASQAREHLELGILILRQEGADRPGRT